ncbi:MAG: hypothetical protein ABI045_06125 [Flavobacteriales bacterium]
MNVEYKIIYIPSSRVFITFISRRIKKTGYWIEKRASLIFSKEFLWYTFFRNIPSEWWSVKELIDHYEMTFSKFCDTNDYFASPILMIKEAVNSLPQKDETGKFLNLDSMETDRGNVMVVDVLYLT